MNDHFDYRINDRDFIVNSIWEGTGDELHYNDIYARRTEFGGRVLSGLALTCLASAHHSAATNWAPPARLDLSFESVVLANDDIVVRQSDMPPETSVDVMTEERRALHMVFTSEEINSPTPSAPTRTSKGRTLTVGDREVFDWWLSQSLPGLQLAEPGIVPWPLVASAVSGAISRIGLVQQPHSSLVNRSNCWRFFRSAEIGETIHAEIHSPSERLSRSKQGWGIWSGTVRTVSDSENDVIAATDWICLFAIGN